MIRTAMSAERDHAQTGFWAHSTLGIRGAQTFIRKTQKDGVHFFQGITEAGSDLG